MKKRLTSATLLLATLSYLTATQARAQEISIAANPPAVRGFDGNGGPASLSTPHAVKLTASAQATHSDVKDTRSLTDPKFDIFGGYSLLSNGFGGRANNHGWNIEATWNMNRNVGFTADFSGHTASTDTTTTFAGLTTTIDLDQDFYYFVFGPKLTYHADKFQIYTHFLAGAAHGRFSNTIVTSAGGRFFEGAKDTNFALVAGAGVNYIATRRWGWRLLEADYLFSTLLTNGLPLGAQDNVRISTGLIFRW